MKKGILFIVPTPIGNLKDITFRAIEILENVDLIGAEDTRNSAKLLKHYNINTNMVSYHQHNESKQSDVFIDRLLKSESIAIISDAGMPGISDPSSVLIKKAIDNKIKVEVIPGATAFLPALIGSGLSAEHFTFIGFMPKKKKEIDSIMQRLISREETLIFYESPHRLHTFLELLLDNFGDRKVAIVREISKLYESYYRGNLLDILYNFEKIKVKGEFVVILEGYIPTKINDVILIKELNESLKSGSSKKSAVEHISTKFNVRKNRVYKLSLDLE